jgi:hypothetical protein
MDRTFPAALGMKLSWWAMLALGPALARQEHFGPVTVLARAQVMAVGLNWMRRLVPTLPEPTIGGKHKSILGARKEQS